MACGCEHSSFETCSQCEFEPFVRNHFFTGKLMGAADFIAESTYHSEKMRHHNVRLHGSGVTCGLKVHQHPSKDCQKRYVVVEPGSALDCCGHEILVPEEEIVDVAQHPTVRDKTNDGALHTLQVVACYRECPTEDVPVLYDECGCDDTQCAANRILESYAFDVLVDPPLSDGLGGGAALGAFTTSNLHGATGWMQASAAGKVAIVDPGDPALPADAGTRVFVLDVVHRSLITVDLPAVARAIAMSQDGARFFVVTDPFTGPECEVHVFDAVDGTVVPPVTAGAVRTVPGTTTATLVSAATTSDASRTLLVLDRTSGDVHPWKADASAGIEDAPTAAVSFVKGSSFAAAADGSFLFAIDAAAKVQVLDTATSSVSALTGLPTTAKPSALAAFSLNAAAMLAIASGDEKLVYVVDRVAGVSKAAVDVAHTPAYLGVTGPDAEPWLTVYEEDAGHAYVQSIALGPISAGDPPLVGAPRAAGDGPLNIVIVHADGQASVVDPARFADSDCSDLVCKQASGCPGCDTPDCVVLATVANYRPGMSLLDMPAVADDLTNLIARLDHRAGRRMLASTATLQAWLECLQLKGGVPGPKGEQGPAGADGADGVDGADGADGADGKDGADGADGKDGADGADGKDGVDGKDACDPDLTEICAINWEHGGIFQVGAAPTGEVIVAFSGEIIDLPDPMVLRHSFIVETDHDELIDRERNLTVKCWCQLVGEYRLLRFKEPCVIGDEDQGQPTAIAFRPSPQLIEGREYRVRVHGDLIQDINKKAIDANHLPPWLPDRPTGDCIEGGTFFSWFTAK